MNHYAELRQLARDRRDREIRAARQAYAEALRRIADVENDLKGRKKLDRDKTITWRIQKLIPTDRPFTLPEIVAALESLDDRRDWQASHVSNQLGKLRRQGFIRRLKRPKRGESAVFVRTNTATEQECDQEAATLKESIRAALEGKRILVTEIVVLLLDGGYKTSMTPRKLRLEVAAVLRENPKLFTPSGNKWRLT